MKFRTHVITALAVSTALIVFTPINEPNFGFVIPLFNWVVFFSIIILGSLLPDLDHSKSFLSNKFGWSLPIKHRGMTHTIYPYFLMIGLGLWYQGFFAEILFWLGIACLLHMFGDCHTNGGVRLLGFGKANYVLPSFIRWGVGNDAIENVWFVGYLLLFGFSMFTIFL